MSGTTLHEAQAQLSAWKAASLAVAQGQSYTITHGNGAVQTVTRANAQSVLEQVRYWEDQVQRLSTGRTGTRMCGVIIRDV